MANCGITRGCLTDEIHNRHEIQDMLAHYLGCIEVSERALFLNLKHPFWKWKEETIYDQLNKQAEKTVGDDGDLDPRAKEATEKRQRQEATEKTQRQLQNLARSIYSQYYRTRIIRAAIWKTRVSGAEAESSEDTLDEIKKSEKKDQSDEDISHLVRCINKSQLDWKQSEEYTAHIPLVRSWRAENGKKVQGPRIMEDEEWNRIISTMNDGNSENSVGDIIFEPEAQTYKVEKDVNGYLLLFKKVPNSKTPDESACDEENSSMRQSGPVSDTKGAPSVKASSSSSSSSATASSSSSYSYVPADSPSKLVRGHFPDQRIPLAHMLADDDHILTGTTDDRDWIKYFHIPYNNMDYAEEIIHRYFGETWPKDASRIGKPPTKSSMVLQPRCWRGQQHEDHNAVVHARHLRPLCETISSAIDRIELEHVSSNLVLFMPYLHWETDRNRERIARLIDKESEKQRRKVFRDNAKNKRERENYRRDLHWSECKKVRHPPEEGNPETTPSSVHTFADVVMVVIDHFRKSSADSSGKKQKKKRRSEIQADEHGRLMPKHPLAQYLIDVARLYEAMSSFRDQKMLEKYLHKDSSLHPRRTLDQSYYWTLKTTKARDRDQVIYRGTTMDRNCSHRFQEVAIPPPERKRLRDAIKANNATKLTSVVVDKVNMVRETAEDKVYQKLRKPEKRNEKVPRTHYQWTDHSDKHDRYGCEHCHSDICKISRIVMVDQVWMWILDKKTIVTCFPRRYGVNKQDHSGVHKSIRQRLANLRQNQIRSVFDLALIILEECSNTFFRRTKTKDRQPQVIDLFSEAIGRVSHNQTILYDLLWHWTEEARKMYRNRSRNADPNGFHAPLLDISREGKLQREIRDIIDELDIMIYLNKKQHEVLKRFVKQVENMLDEEGHMRERSAACCDCSRSISGRLEEKSAEYNTKPAEQPKDQQKRVDFDSFRIQAADVLFKVEERIKELESLRTSAEITAKSVTELLGVKQQQAGVLQAWQSVKQGEETVRQGRSIMMFTLVTIVFLPLAFMSSIFGMNNTTFSPNDQDGNPMLLIDQIKWMLVVASIVIFFSVLIAFRGFSHTLRAILWSWWIYGITWLLVTSGIYTLYLVISEAWDSQKIVRTTEDKVQKLKDQVRMPRKAKKRKDLTEMALYEVEA